MKVETFIEKIASKSSLSGEPYKVILPSGKIIFTRDWLYDELKNKPKQ